MSIFKAIIMGIVQGAAEFLPVSSSGHLVIFGKLLGINEPNNTFEVLLHLGTLVAIFVVYHKDVKEMIIEFFGMVRDLFKGEFNLDNPYRKLVALIIVASIPTAILGFAFQDTFESLFGSILPVGIALLITGTLLYVSDKIREGKKDEKRTNFRNATVIGIVQGLAITPGISRSGSTIVAGLFLGLKREMAVRFSFLMSIPAVLGAVLLKGKDIIEAGTATEGLFLQYGVGAAVAAIVGILSIKLLEKVVLNKKFHYFAYYCWAVGAIAIGAFILG